MLCDRADVAQLVEQLIRNEQVVGSIPIISSSVINASEVFGGFFVVLVPQIGVTFIWTT